jgi:general secretion pathway protein G
MTPSVPARRPARPDAGFTLIELMVVLIVLGLLAALVFPRLAGVGDKARADTTRAQIKGIEDALEQFNIENGFFPSTEQGLAALVSRPSSGQEAKKYREGGYLKSVPKDGWENPFVYLSPGSHGDYDIISYGADGVPGGDGKNADITNWEEN